MNSGSFKKGQTPWNKGKRWSDEVKKKISDSKLLNPLTGSKNGNYKHGNEWKCLRKKIFERDDYTCQICGYKEEEIMVVDHILPKSIFPELEFDLLNLQTLCPNCHARKTISDKKKIAESKKGVNSEKVQNG